MKTRRVFIQVEADSNLPIKEIKHYVKKKLDIVALDQKESSNFYSTPDTGKCSKEINKPKGDWYAKTN